MSELELDHALLALLGSLWSEDPLADRHVETRLRHLLADTWCCMIAGLRDPSVRAYADSLESNGGCSTALPGAARPRSRMDAIAAACMSACAFEAPEGLASAHGRPGLHVIPALVAQGDQYRLGDILAATAVGYEIGGRLGAAYAIPAGMHVDGTWGTFGAAAAICKLRGLSPAHAMAAINAAACQLPLSLYHPIKAGSLVRNLYVGHGAMLAEYCVNAVVAGFEDAPGALAEHARFLLGGRLAPEWRHEGQWLVTQGYLKKHPAVRHVHYGIEAALAWRRINPLPLPGERICLYAYPEALTYCGIRAPGSAIQAQFSLAWGTAWALVHGGYGIEAYADGGLDDERVRDTESRIELIADDGAEAEGIRRCRLQIGSSLPVEIDELPGDPTRPLTRDELVDKALAGIAPLIGAAEAGEFIRQLLDAPANTRLIDIHSTLAPAGGS